MKKPFDKIKLTQLHRLCNTLADTQVRDIGNIKRKYSENAFAFDETLAFLEDLKLVKNNSNELSPTKFSTIQNSIDEFKKQLLPVLFSANGEVSERLRSFLVNFQIQTESIFFKATDTEKIKFSDIRNLLLELDFISVDTDNSTYLVNPLYVDLFITQFKKRKLSPQTLKRKQAESEIIGLNAEKAVIEFEIKRLTNISINRDEIELISEENAVAGYDIKSFENFLDCSSNRIDRYIEVKAVSIHGLKFFWSRTEMETAKIFGEKYYLYLLPAISNNTFDFENLLIIQNPFKNIYSDNSEWMKQDESISFSKNIDE